MNVDYFYCSACGFEEWDLFVEHAGHYANGDFYYCPKCQEQSSDVCILDGLGKSL